MRTVKKTLLEGGQTLRKWIFAAISVVTLAILPFILPSSAALGAGTESAKIAIVAGGPHPYFASWPQAGSDATRDFHLRAADFKAPQSWSLSQQNDLIESLASQGYNAFLIFPGDPTGTRNVVAELADQDIPTIALAGCLQDPSKAAFCFATDTEASAYLGTKALIKAIGGKGRIAHFTGFLTDPGTALRMLGVKRAVDETHGSVTLVQTIADIDAPEAAQDKINAFLATQGKSVDGIITTAWIPATVSATALRKIGDKRIRMIGLNDDPTILNGIKDGYVTGTMVQNPYGQAYAGSYMLGQLIAGCKVKANAPWLKTPQTDRFIDSGSLYVDESNLATYSSAINKITQSIVSSFDKTYLTCP
jgi:ribose transport system substrate-binding protein